MRHIILFRHANAISDSPSGADFDRELSELGKKQADESAAWIASHLKEPCVALVSTAKRTQQTADALRKHLPNCKFINEAAVYEASPATLMKLLDDNKQSPLILVGHNPGLESTLALLTTGQSSASRGMGVASVAWITCGENGISPGCADLKLFHSV
jgi:phosphohistidine phosphatase